MLSCRLNHVLILVFLHYVDGQRRINDGLEIKGEKRYMVILAQAQSSIRNYDSWICGGAIVSRFFILTSAACVEDVQSMYAISGTKHYISSANIYNDRCAIVTKKKVVFTCVPKEYEFNFTKAEKWSYNDIALVKVETAYNFESGAYTQFCDYKPNSIKINYDVQNEKTDTDVIVLGYGHISDWRQTDEHTDLNQPLMRYSTSKIINLDNCKNLYKSPDFISNIDKYMFCTNGSGRINEHGQLLQETLNFRRNHHEHHFNMRSTKGNINSTFNRQTRRQGFCQNDHGGPLVAWINNEETVLGVASVFSVNTLGKCVGPYLYTSTARNKMFIECIIYDQMTRRNDICDQPASKRGFSILRRYIMWNENEDRFVDNEEIRIRPQVNMNLIGLGGDVKK